MFVEGLQRILLAARTIAGMRFQEAGINERAVVDGCIENLPIVGGLKVGEDEPGQDKEDEDDGG